MVMELIKHFFDASQSALFIIKKDMLIFMVNKRAVELFGFQEHELTGKSINTVVPTKYRKKHTEQIEKYILNPVPRPMGAVTKIFPGQKKDGTEFPCEIVLIPVNTDAYGPLVLASVLDATEKVKAEATFMQTHEELEQFAYRTSHDLRSPLLSIGMLSDCIIDDMGAGDIVEAAKNVLKIKALTSKLQNLVEDILILTKTNLPSEPLTVFDFNAVITAIMERLEKQISDNKIKFHLDFSHKTPLVTQKTRLTQVLDNLISNAVKYYDKNKIGRIIYIRTKSDNGFQIDIEDNGIGIPKDRQPEMFGIFKRFHNDEIPGSGLGLYITKKHLDKMNAQITFESSNQGTSFHIKLPSH